ncbi:MAG: heavy metal-responsive transcriptional regulator [Candidatus Acidulodesulfobacterium ferriphilum]|jgi:MerR family mercuric resistance operon transcriptional regulator|uniref:Heavy metal-responsive transcriptional regulator n=1 Tax=Candidatus Acidulodesulfobacterium ferriphilum TaxID=2597223 RepID=A0A519BDL5_9DELT|nr:MAG: heavy metal-responsive transcriptional regulator [Candidatus Acidulodesulfobacterium ferriphilum]
MTIGQLAKTVNLNTQTIRYYERIGLINKPDTNEAGYRIYPEKAADVLRFIKHAKDIGFSLKQISELFSLDNNKYNTCSNVKKLAEEKVYEIDKKLNSLNLMRKELLNLISLCEEKTDNQRCPILDILKFES